MAFLPVKEGGLGFQSAAARCEAAFLASWEATSPALQAELELYTSFALRAAVPAMDTQVGHAFRFLAAQGAPVSARRPAGQQRGRQKQLTTALVRSAQRSLRNSLADIPTAILLSGGGQGKAALMIPRCQAHEVSDDEFAVFLRRRLLYPDPSGRAILPCGHASVGPRRTVCQHQAAQPDWGVHPLSCNVGPGWDRRHADIRDTWLEWLKERFGVDRVLREHVIHQWNRTKSDGEVERAVLDVVVTVPGHGLFALDISVTDAAAESYRRPAARARPGTAAKTREGEKHRRYPTRADTPILVPIIYEAGGRAGGEAETWLRGIVSDVDSDEQADAIRDIRQRTAAALVRGNAGLLTSAGPPAQGWPWR